MNIRILSYLVAIETYGSISEAAKRLYVSQPYLSKILHDIEEEYRVTIFTRGKNGMQPTEKGRLFLDMAKELIQDSERFGKIFKEGDGSSSLRIAAFPSSYIIDAYLRMVKSMPEQSFRFHYKEESTIDVIQDIYSRAADVGVLFLKEQNHKLTEEFFKSRRIVCHPIFNARLHVIVRSGHPLTLKEHLTLDDLYQYNIVMYYTKKGTGIYSLEDGYYNKFSLPELIDFERFRQIIYIYSRASMHNILNQTDYIALGSQATLDQSENFGLVSLPFPFPDHAANPDEYSNTLYYIHLMDRPLSPLARCFVNFLLKCYSSKED